MNKHYVYCHTCKQMIAQTNENSTATAVLLDHYGRNEKKCEITIGDKAYFKRFYPDIDLEDKVTITIHGGCAEIMSKSSGIEVEIRDYDVEGSWDEKEEDCKKNDYGKYREMIWDADDTVP